MTHYLLLMIGSAAIGLIFAGIATFMAAASMELALAGQNRIKKLADRAAMKATLKRLTKKAILRNV